jgi:Tfp pilus assembly protein PilO
VSTDRTTLAWTGGIAVMTVLFLLIVTRSQLKRRESIASELQARLHAQMVQEQNKQAIAALERRLTSLENQARTAAARVPDEPAISGFVEELARITSDRMLRTDRIEPAEPWQEGNLWVQPITFRVRGGFLGIHGLIKDIDHLPRLTQVARFETTVDEDSPQEVVALVSLRIFHRAS